MAPSRATEEEEVEKEEKEKGEEEEEEGLGSAGAKILPLSATHSWSRLCEADIYRGALTRTIWIFNFVTLLQYIIRHWQQA